MLTSLLTDRYELTMLQAGLRSGAAHRRSVFEIFTRRLAPGRRYGVVAGTGRFLESLADFRFEEEELDWLSSHEIVDAPTIEWLANYQFTGNIWGYQEGEIFFPGSPVLVVEGTFAEAVVLETLALSIFNHDSAIASAAARMVSAAGERPCLEMGSRRTHEISAIAAARAAVVAGFAGTSNLAAGMEYEIPTIGTAAHAFTLVHDSEKDAFSAQIDSLGAGTTLLVDTYNVVEAVRTAIDVAGPKLGSVRLDSGDLVAQAHEVRALLDELGAHETEIVVTSDLDEHAIAALAQAPVDSYGVGTSLVTGSSAPTAGMVYKIVARENSAGKIEPVAKAGSGGKAGIGGRKRAARVLDSHGIAIEEAIWADPEYRWESLDSPALPLPDHAPGQRELLVPLILDGELTDRSMLGSTGLQRASAHHAETRAELPRAALRLQRGDPALETVNLAVS